MDLGVKGKVALVTGGDSGIGWHTAQRLLGEGATVVLTDADADKLEEAVSRLDGPRTRIRHHPADVTSLDSLAELRTQVQEQAGAVDILVHCAGVTGATGLFHEISDEGWVRTIETDLLAAVRVVRTFLDDLRTGGWGRLVLLASEDAVQPYVDELPYCAAKAGILSLAKGLSKTYAADGLLVNAVSPAFIETPMTDAMMAERAAEKGTSVEQAVRSFLDQERPTLELQRRGQPEEVAAVIAFLCSDLASFVTGSNYRVDGGSVATL